MLSLIREALKLGGKLVGPLAALVRELQSHPDPEDAIRRMAEMAAHEKITHARLQRMGKL